MDPRRRELARGVFRLSRSTWRAGCISVLMSTCMYLSEEELRRLGFLCNAFHDGMYGEYRNYMNVCISDHCWWSINIRNIQS